MDDKPSNDRRPTLLKRVASGLDSFAAGVGVAALLAGVTAYLVRRKQKSPTSQAVIETQPPPAPTSPPRQPGDSIMQQIRMLWRFVFIVLALFVMITSVTDVWWVILLSSALIMYFVVTGAGVWRLQKWGFVLLAVGLIGLVVLSLVSDARDSDVVGFVWRVSILVILLPGLPVLWKLLKAR